MEFEESIASLKRKFDSCSEFPHEVLKTSITREEWLPILKLYEEAEQMKKEVKNLEDKINAGFAL